MHFAKSTEIIAARRNLPNTERQDAVVHQTGTTVAHSVPVRGATNKPKSTDRKSDASLCSADICGGSGLVLYHHAKSGQGFGDGVPGGGEAARFSSLDQIQTNRNKQLGRGKHCGRYSVRGQVPNSAEMRFHRVNCKSWNCSFCAPRRAKRYKHAIRATAEALQLCRFVTLTLDPSKMQGDPVRYLNAAFAKLRVYLQRHHRGSPQYIRVLEFQKNGNPHFHILVDRLIEIEWIRKAWVAVGGGYMVDIQLVDVHRVSRYLSKYLTKELLMSAPLRCRRVTTSRGIKLFEKVPSEIQWELLRVSIYRLRHIYAADVSAEAWDEDQLLESFTVILNG